MGYGAEGEKLLNRLKEHPGVSLFFGAMDTGKTTLIRNLASSLSSHGLTAVIDCDVGQSSVGPPACVGACRVKGSLKSESEAEMLHFVGDFSPQGVFLPLLNGLISSLRWVRRKGSIHILVDTTGFVTGGAALELKYHKVELARPRHVIVLERGKELDPLLNSLRSRQDMEVHRLRASKAATAMGVDERRAYRQGSLSRYFQDANIFTMPLNPKVMVNPYVWQEDQESLLNRLVGLLNGQGGTLAMGVIREADFEKQRLEVETPLALIEGVTHLRLGKIQRA